MQNNDLSNQFTPRVLVTLDVVASYKVEVEKKLKFIPVVKSTQVLNRMMLSRLYMFSTHAGYTLELVGFDISDKDLGLELEAIDNVGTNPFRYYTAYESIDHLVAELPYRPEVLGVLDIPERMLRYGHWGMDYTRL